MLRFSLPTSLQLDLGPSDSRTISGIAVPWNVDATVNDGQVVRFAPGSLATDGRPPKLIEFHDLSRPVGLVVERVSTELGMSFKAKVSQTAAGSDALTLALDGVLDSVSVGVKPTAWTMDGATMVVTAGDWLELSLVTEGAFTAAKISDVQATQHQETTIMSEIEQPAPPVDEPVEEEAKPTAIAAQLSRGTIAAQQHRAPSYRVTASPGEYMSAMKTNAAEFENIRAAVALDTTSDVPGIIPTPILAPVFSAIEAARPLITAFGTRAMPPSGKIFIRPVITTHVSIAEQANQGDQLSSTALEIDDVPVTKKTFGGVVALSEQVIDWAAPSMVDALVTDLARIYANQTEAYICGELYDSVGQTINSVDFTDAESLIGALYQAAAEQAAATNVLPDFIALSPNMWQAFGSLVDLQGRPIFPTYNPTNAPGSLNLGSYMSNPLGVRLIVSSGFAEDTVIVGASRGFEIYEQMKGLLRMELVSTLTTEIAFRGYVASLGISPVNLTSLVATAP
jgi:HK97 family phage major capsid protein